MGGLFKYFALHCEDLIRNSTIGDSSRISANAFLWGVIEHFADVDEKEYSSILDDQYGELRLPRYFKFFEIEKDSLLGVVNCYEIYEHTSLKLKKDTNYLWLINEHGSLIIGEEESISKENNAGHVALSKGRPSRIAGELQFSKEKKCWVVNHKSGRYSGNYSSVNSKEYLINSIKKRFNAYIKNHEFIIDNSDDEVQV